MHPRDMVRNVEARVVDPDRPTAARWRRNKPLTEPADSTYSRPDRQADLFMDQLKARSETQDGTDL